MASAAAAVGVYASSKAREKKTSALRAWQRTAPSAAARAALYTTAEDSPSGEPSAFHWCCHSLRWQVRSVRQQQSTRTSRLSLMATGSVSGKAGNAIRTMSVRRRCDARFALTWGSRPSEPFGIALKVPFTPLFLKSSSPNIIKYIRLVMHTRNFNKSAFTIEKKCNPATVFSL